MTMPHRIQVRRGVKGWRKPAGVIYVNRTTRYGNPFIIGAPGVPDAATAVQLHKAWMLNPNAPPMRINKRLVTTPPAARTNTRKGAGLQLPTRPAVPRGHPVAAGQHMTATDRFNRALLALAATGNRVRCSDPITNTMWTSEHQQDRDIAARWCRGSRYSSSATMQPSNAARDTGFRGAKDLSVKPGRPKRQAA